MLLGFGCGCGIWMVAESGVLRPRMQHISGLVPTRVKLITYNIETFRILAWPSALHRLGCSVPGYCDWVRYCVMLLMAWSPSGGALCSCHCHKSVLILIWPQTLFGRNTPTSNHLIIAIPGPPLLCFPASHHCYIRCNFIGTYTISLLKLHGLTISTHFKIKPSLRFDLTYPTSILVHTLINWCCI